MHLGEWDRKHLTSLLILIVPFYSQFQESERAETEGEGGAAGEAASTPEWPGESLNRGGGGVAREDHGVGPQQVGGSFL